jgi:hypothetical protein
MEDRKAAGRPRKVPAEAELQIAAAVEFYRGKGFALRDKGVTDDDAWIIRNAPWRIDECRGRLGACRLVSAIYLNSTVGPDLVEQYYDKHKSTLGEIVERSEAPWWELHKLKRGLITQFNPDMLTHNIADSAMPVPDTPRYRKKMAELMRTAPRIGKPRDDES